MRRRQSPLSSEGRHGSADMASWRIEICKEDIWEEDVSTWSMRGRCVAGGAGHQIQDGCRVH